LKRGSEEGGGVVGRALVDGTLRRVGRSGVKGEVGVGVEVGDGVGVRRRGEVGRSWTIILFGHAVGGPSLLEIERAEKRKRKSGVESKHPKIISDSNNNDLISKKEIHSRFGYRWPKLLCIGPLNCDVRSTVVVL
jgi:hypothetical protein